MMRSRFDRRDQVMMIICIPLLLFAPGVAIPIFVVWSVGSWLWDRWENRAFYRREREYDLAMAAQRQAEDEALRRHLTACEMEYRLSRLDQ